MLAMKELRLQLGELLAADATLLAPVADNNEIVLIKAAFALGETMVIGGLTLADFDGSTPLLAGLGTQAVGIDPMTQDQVITINEPAGGFRFETSGMTNLPQTIFGYALTTKNGVKLLAVELLDEPITLANVGEQINLGSATLRVVPTPMF